MIVVDPEALFSSLFGGERFTDIIGVVSLGQELKSAMVKTSEEDEAQAQSDQNKVTGTDKKAKKELSPEEKAAKAEQDRAEAAERARVREERVVKLIAALLKKISIFTEVRSLQGTYWVFFAHMGI